MATKVGSGPDPEATYTKAAKAELAKNFDLAFKLYIKAAEDFLHQSRTSSEGNLKSHFKSRAGVALQRAEKIKSVRPDVTPVVRNPFSEQSQLSVLKKSSRVDGRNIKLWTEPRCLNEDPISHPDLSSLQIERGSVWRSSTEIFPQMSIFSASLQPTEISQRIVTDCSVCASIVVCLGHHRRFNSRLGMSALFPQDADGVPCSSSLNTHEVRFQFNGAPRRIVIDDKLPVSSQTNDLTCLSTGRRQVVWPALIEKAYMKVMGGYDFPGSNSSTDLHTLIGWIPEHVSMSCKTFQREKTWARIYKGFSEGRCVLTLGTLERDDIYWRNVHMLPAHCYAVTDLGEYEGERHVTVLDSWALGSQEFRPSNSGSRILVMTWDEVCQVFEDAYLSWDPAYFKHTLSFHGLWRPKNSSSERSEHQHLRLWISPDDPVESPNKPELDLWVLLTRHVTETRRTSDFIALRIESSIDRKIEQKFEQIAQTGTYTNSSHVLVQATPREIVEGVLSFIASYDGDLEDVGFTLTVYSTTASLSWDESPAKLQFSHKVEGLFTSKNSGGNHTFPSYMINPQYHLRVQPVNVAAKGSSSELIGGRGEKAKMTFVGQAGKDAPINISVVWSDGERIFDLIQSDIVCSSGTYGYGYTAASGDLLAGDYTIIVSSFEPQCHFGPYTIQVESSRRFEIQYIPQEGAGMYSKVVKGSWQGNSGGPSSDRYLENPAFNLQVTSTCQIKIRLQLTQQAPSISLNVTVFPAPTGPSSRILIGRHVMTSGPYTDSISGVVTPLYTLQPGSYFIIPSTFQEGVEKSFKMEVFSSVAGVKVEAREKAISG